MKVGLIGEKLGHSFSKTIHEQLTDYTYDLIPLSEAEFHDFMKKKAFDAINVTIPYKEKVIPYIDELDEKARQIQAVNAIKNVNGKLIGTNTDFDGLKNMIVNHFDLTDEVVAICGSGGTSKTALAVLKTLDVKEIIQVARNRKAPYVTYEEMRERQDITYIINTTSVGMCPDFMSSIIHLDDFRNIKGVIDVVYNPLCTSLCYEAKQSGVKNITGLEMLVGQAVEAIAFFLDIKMDHQIIKKMTHDILLSKQNLVLISEDPLKIEKEAKQLADNYKMDYYLVNEVNLFEVMQLNHALLNASCLTDEKALSLNGYVIKIDDINVDVYSIVKEAYDEIINY